MQSSELASSENLWHWV